MVSRKWFPLSTYINSKGKKYDDGRKLGDGKDKFNNDILKQCETSKLSDKKWGTLGCTQLYELTSIEQKRSLLKNAEL